MKRCLMHRPRTGMPDERDPTPHYLTDGTNLYRFVGWVSRSVETKFGELEDCRSLNILLVSAQELNGGNLRPVQ